ncbi:MAG: thiamine-monophosphate kinase, partial [Hyphomicrobium sp.]
TDRRPGPLTVTISAVGAVPAGRVVRRGTGRAGDDLLLSGTIGDGALGLLMRQDPERGAALGLGADGIGHLVARYLRPQPRLGLAAHVLAFASAAMDVSDGLVKDCARLALASGVGAEIDASRLPLSPAARAAITREPSLMASVLGGGDDYEVLAAASPDSSAAFREAALASGVALTSIGRLVAGAGVAVFDGDGGRIEISRAGWDHFLESWR